MSVNQHIVPFLMFLGDAEEAMNFYVSVFDESRILHVSRYGKDEGGKEGSVVHAEFLLKGHEFMCIDSAVDQPFTFTPAMSLYVVCESEEEIDRLFARLSEGGKVFMELATYPFAEKYGWVNDKFGVSWQLNLEKPQR